MAAAIQVFSCPSCKETINTSMTECAYCHVPIDAASALSASETMSKVNQACSDASYLRIMAGMMGTFFVVRYIPFLGMVGMVGFLGLLFAVPIMAIRWRVKFGSIKSDDPEFLRARKTTMLFGIGAPVLGILAFVAVSFLFAMVSRS
jgi:hypothetical protein